MRSFIFCTKVFAVSTLIFLNFSFALAQDAPINVLPAGKRIRVRMETEINSMSASVNDTFLVRIAEPVSNKGVVVLPAGTMIDGRILAASSAAFGGIDGKLDIRFEKLRLNRDDSLAMDARLLKPIRSASRGMFTFLTVAGLTAAGAIIGGVSKAENGTAIGAAIGAGAGTGSVFLRKGRDVRIKTNEEFEIELKKQLVLPTSEV